MKFPTRAIHVGEEPKFEPGGTGDVVVPVHLSTTFARKEIDHPTGGFEYSRTGNPTRHALELRLASLENARFGLAFSSGLAAQMTVVLALLKQGDHVIAFDDLYGGTKRQFDKVFSKFGIECTYVDARDPANVERALRDRTRMIWLESPTNPLMRLCDIKAIAAIKTENEIITVVDNTFATPYFQHPLDLGADIVVHSATKYISGHSDVVQGAVMVINERYFEALKYHQNALGAIPSPFDCFLTLRGIKTLALRMECHAKNALSIAEHLNAHPKVKKVIHPGLAGYQQYELAKSQMSGASGMLSFELRGGLEDVKTFFSGLEIFALAESLGGVESLIEHPGLMTHASITRAEQEKIGIGDTLIRVSVGIEDVEDLIADLDGALDRV